MPARTNGAFIASPDWYVTHDWGTTLDVTKMNATSADSATGIWTITLGDGGGDQTQVEVNVSQVGGTQRMWTVEHSSDTVKIVRFWNSDTGAAAAPAFTSFWARRVPATP